MGIMGVGWHHYHSKQKSFHTQMVHKYFMAYSDDQIKNFDGLMRNQRRQQEQAEQA